MHASLPASFSPDAAGQRQGEPSFVATIAQIRLKVRAHGSADKDLNKRLFANRDPVHGSQDNGLIQPHVVNFVPFFF